MSIQTGVALLGHSVGAGACLLAASRESVASMAHPADLMHRALRRRLPRFAVHAVLRNIEKTIGHRFEDFAPVRTISLVRGPILVLPGVEDARVPVQDALRLVEAGGKRGSMGIGLIWELAELPCHFQRTSAYTLR